MWKKLSVDSKKGLFFFLWIFLWRFYDFIGLFDGEVFVWKVGNEGSVVFIILVELVVNCLFEVFIV